MNESILHVVSSLDPSDGGVSVAVAGLAIAQKKLGCEVCIAANYRRGADQSLVHTAQDAGVEVVMIGPAFSSYQWHGRSRKVLEKLIEEHSVLHVQALWEHIQYMACTIAMKLDKPYVVTTHGMLEPWSLAQSRLKKKIYFRLCLKRMLESASVIHFTGEVEAAKWPSAIHYRSKIIIPNGIALVEFESLPERSKLRSEFNIPMDAHVILFLGRLHEKKGCELLLRGFAGAINDSGLQEGNQPYLLFVGPAASDEAERLQHVASDLGLRTVLVLGPLYQEDKLDAFAAADVFALVSQQENFGIAVVEALACGCPVLISDQVGLYSLVQRERVGWVIEYNQSHVKTALKNIFNTPIESFQREKCRQVAKQFDWAQIADQWLQEYTRIAKSGSGVELK